MTNKVKHAFALASRRTLFFQHRAFRDAGSDLRYGFRPLPLYAYVARHDGGRIVSFSQLSWIASGNYAGYLAGSLLFSFGAFHQPSRLRPFLLASALASGLLILAMAWLLPFILVLLIRVLAGVASAGMLILVRR